MTYKKVGIAQDSNLRGDSVRIQEKSNPLDYIEFTFDGTGTQSYKMPSSAGTSGQVLRIATSNTLEWSTAVGPQGPIGPTGLPGSNGSSGSSGSSGVSGSSGASGTSGSSGSSGQSGSQGVSGTSGSSGSSGQSGSSGSSGQTGQASSIVSQGTSPGFTILQFNDGTTVLVPDGATGSAGTDGTSGTSGTSGSSGQNGTSGTSGISATVNSFSTSGGFVNVVFNDSTGSTIVPIPVGADGSSGSSGSSGAAGVNGAAGSSGSSGSSGANGVGNATILGDVNYVPKYLGATALGTASMIAIGEQIRFSDGSTATPSITFQSDTDTGIFRIAANDIGFAVGGNQRFRIADVALLTQVPLRVPDGSVTFPSLTFLNDLDTGILRPGDNRMSIITGGVTAASFNTTGVVLPNLTNTYLAVNATGQIVATASASSGSSGSSGQNGTSGTSGTSGSSGVSGTSGTSGSSGVSGTSGTSGVFDSTSQYALTVGTFSVFTSTASISGTFTQSLAVANHFVYTLTGNTTFGFSNARNSTYNFLFNCGTFSLTLQTGLFRAPGSTFSGVTGSVILSGVYDGSRMWIASSQNYGNI